MGAVDVNEHTEAFLDVLAEATGRPVFEFGDVPGTEGNEGTLPPVYLVLGVYRVDVGDDARRYDGTTEQTGWELELSHAGRTIREAGALYAVAARALDDQVLSIGLDSTGPIRFVSDDLPILQRDRWIGRSTWAYGL